MKRLAHDIEVEPLQERAWDRIEHRVFARLDAQPASAAPAPAARKALWRIIALAALATAAVALALVALLPRHDADRTARAPSPSQVSRVVTGDTASSVTLGEASLEVAPRSAVVLGGDDDRGLLVVLERGRVRCAVPPRRDRPAFEVQAGDVSVRVVGTDFAVVREGDAARVLVFEGIVEVASGGRIARVSAGDTWPPAAEPGPAVLDMEPDVLPPAAAPARPRAAPRTESLPPAAHAPVISPPPPSAAARYRRAASLEAADPDAAAAIYEALAGAGGDWAAPALFAHARLELDRGRHRQARRLLRRYLNLFPRGLNAADARRLLEEIE